MQNTEERTEAATRPRGMPVSGDMGRRPWITLRRALLIVFVVGVIAHLLILGGTSLVVTDDGVDYFNTAFPLHQYGVFTISKYRTPGYPLLLALSFLLFGVNGVGVMIIQHTMAVATTLCITAIAARLVRPWVAMIVGLAHALSPAFLGFASIMLTESVSVFVFIVPIFLVLCWRRRPVTAALLAMAVFGYALLIRPGSQVALPFLFMAVVARPGVTRRQRVTMGVGALVGLMAVCAPWLYYNARRGVSGFAQGVGGTLWIALVQQDLLDKNYPIPPEMAERYAPVKAQVGASLEMWTFIGSPAPTQAMVDEAPRILGKWAYHSIAAHPGAYLARLPWVMLWQMGVYPDSGFIKLGQYSWFFGMLGFDESIRPNAKFPSIVIVADAPDVMKLGIAGHGKWVRHFYWWYQFHYPQGVPEIPLCVLSLAAGVIAIRRKDWQLVWVLLASAAIVGVHVFMLLAQNRYSLPAVALWYATGTVTLGAIFPRLRATPGAEGGAVAAV